MGVMVGGGIKNSRRKAGRLDGILSGVLKWKFAGMGQKYGEGDFPKEIIVQREG